MTQRVMVIGRWVLLLLLLLLLLLMWMLVLMWMLLLLAMMLSWSGRLLDRSSAYRNDIFRNAALRDGSLMGNGAGRQLPGPTVLLASFVEVDKLLMPHQKITDVHVSICHPESGRMKLSCKSKGNRGITGIGRSRTACQSKQSNKGCRGSD
jgi:hypothetical protein